MLSMPVPNLTSEYCQAGMHSMYTRVIDPSAQRAVREREKKRPSSDKPNSPAVFQNSRISAEMKNFLSQEIQRETRR